MGTEAQFSREGQQLCGSKSFAGSDVLVTPQVGRAGFGAQPLGGGSHGYWEEEAICVEMKVSMTLWLDGSRWLWPLVDSVLWYNTRLLEDTVGLALSRWEGCRCWMPAGSWLGMWMVVA